MPDQPWTGAPLVALDLEGSGAQDHENEAILEIAFVPLVAGRPDMATAWHSLVNPGRRIPRRPWSPPGLTSDQLAAAPPIDDLHPQLQAGLSGRVLVGHNIGVDWRLLHRHLPNLQIAGLIDTLRLARVIHPGRQRLSLTDLLGQHGLTQQIDVLVPGQQPHRALWDTAGAALLLPDLIRQLPGEGTLSFSALEKIAGLSVNDERNAVEQQLPLEF
ncbi:exonuclease domain-containing protein [Spongiactinospora sp. 9N601]|uniref:3'-5' exonuclease n=1 Tax=Spongiactinospora sp. 9N601 TaxID=3375149 RepID=UPI0037BA2924